MSRLTKLLRNPLVWVAIAAGIGFLLGRGDRLETPAGEAEHVHAGEAEKETIWTCSMHPQIRLPKPGQCPICFMDLIPLREGAGADEGGPPRLEMSEAARALAEIETAPVVRDRPHVEVRLVGKIDYDETRVTALTAWVPGRLDRLYVDYTGIRVRPGDHLAEIYSPDLVSAQEELLQALRTRDETSASASPRMREAAEATVNAARDKLHLLGMTAAQIDELARLRRSSDHVTLYAQTGGVVIEKNALEGDYVQTGAVIYRISDLSHVWVKLDAFESDLAWLRYGQEVEFTAEALPGSMFRGRISFIAPTLDPRTRTVKVRVNVDNPDGLLKPEMLVRATVLAEVDASGGVVAEDLAGKWICPMHPEIVKDRKGSCDVCGMDLVRATELGWVSPPEEGLGPLLVPRSALLFTGKRAVAYVEVPGAERPTYEGREVVPGPRAGDLQIIREGLEEGERVVVRGNFKIDSALQIQAKPSMMSPQADGAEPVDATAGVPLADDDFRRAIDPVYRAYFDLGAALAADDVAVAREATTSLRTALKAVGEKGLTARGRREWRRIADELQAALDGIGPQADIETLRVSFENVSKAILALHGAFGHVGDKPFYRTHCPMAFDFRGADWLQDHETIANPYFGAKMLRCGEVRETLAAAGTGGG